MAKPQQQLPDHNRFSFAYQQPEACTYGLCDCGCGEEIVGTHLEWEGLKFPDRVCLFNYLKTEGLREVG